MAQIPESPEHLSATKTPFQNIGLAFSGGGFRAAAFCLGNMSYMQQLVFDEKTLLSRVSYISSASGGTITNAMYALSQAKGGSFGSFYKKVFENMEDVCLLEKVFENLNSKDVWKDCPHKRRNLINAFALTYDQLLLDGKKVSDLKAAQQDCCLDEVCFNTTEFYRGLLFRQAIKLKKDEGQSRDKGFLYGNYIIHVLNGAEDELRLSDLLAASSCFPAGFEPIIFPNDFVGGESKRKVLDNLCIQPQELKCEELAMLYGEAAVNKLLEELPKPFTPEQLAAAVKTLKIRDEFKAGFMDGGITDNPAVESIMKANERREKKETDFKPFDLMLINDVGSHFMDPFKTLSQGKIYKGLKGLSIRNVLSFSILMAAICALVIWMHFHCKNDTLWNWPAIFSSFLLFGFLAIITGILVLRRFIRGKLKSGGGLDLEKNFSKQIVDMFFDHFGSTPIGVLTDMLKERFNSILTINNDVFLKRIRYLLYDRFLDKGRCSFRIKTNHIYDLSYSNDLNRLNNDPKTIVPGPLMQNVAQLAFEMSTTLWFADKDRKDNSHAALVACGQFTVCYNLLVYVQRMKEKRTNGGSFFTDLPLDEQAKITELEIQLNRDFARFNTDPFWLYNQLGKEWEIKGYEHLPPNAVPFPAKEFGGLR